MRLRVIALSLLALASAFSLAPMAASAATTAKKDNNVLKNLHVSGMLKDQRPEDLGDLLRLLEELNQLLS